MRARARLRRDVSGVSEVVGTILILMMTVVLFSVIILWVTSMPTPTGQTRLDILSRMDPIYGGLGLEIGVNITLVHQGGAALPPVPTIIYVTSQRGTNPPQTDTLILHAYDALLATPNGLQDGTDSRWDIGERWAYKNFALRSSDQIRVTIVDKVKSVIVWEGSMNALQGFRPPVFVDKWTDGIGSTDAVDPVQASLGFYLFARVSDPDNDLDTASVYATITAWYGSGVVCEMPLQMRDDGVFPDRVARDGIFTLGGNVCVNSPYPALSWAGSVILLNASDQQGHRTVTRLVMDVVQPSTGGGGGTIPSQLWQYIGYVQIRTGEAWVSNLNKPYATTTTFQPYRITAGTLNGDGGPLFHFKMANHGNTTIFIDGWTSAVFTSSARASVSPLYIVKPVDPARPANAGGIAAYPGVPTNPGDFQYAQVFDIDPFNQEKGGVPTEVLAAAKSAFRNDWPTNFRAETLFINILISGMAGPANMTYQQIITRWGPTYNPINHLYDADRTTRTSWYAQVIPFIGMVVY